MIFAKFNDMRNFRKYDIVKDSDSSLDANDYLVLNYLSDLNEKYDKTLKESEKVSEDVYYHGSIEDIEGYLNSPINWITKDFNYAKTFALKNGYVYECSATLGNLLDVGKTDAKVFDMLPTKPLKFSREFTAIIRKLDISEDAIRKIISNVASEYGINEYRLAIRPVVRSMSFKRILEGLGYNGIRAIEYDSVNDKDVETFGLFDKVKVLGKVDESLDEEKAITFGDLDYAKKTDTRKMMGGRGTGHFGTGFYFVGKDGPYGITDDGQLKYDYEPSRPVYEIELDNYNLYKPKDNDSAYKLHDTLKLINGNYESSLDKWLTQNIDEEKLKDELFNLGWNLVDEDLDDDFDLDDDDIDLDFDDLEDTSSDDYEDAVKEQDKSLDKYRELVKEFIAKYELEDYVWKDIDTLKSGEIERHVEDAIREKFRSLGLLEYALDTLSKMFNVDKSKLLDIIHKAYESNSEDSISTMIMKSLGYEGVDVTHLNKDAQGLSGLDNFGYGTVVYDLKPGTFKRIKEPRRGGSIHAKAGESIEDLDEYYDKIDDKGDDWGSYGYEVMSDCPIYMTDEPYKIKSMLEKGDQPYRILYLESENCYLIQSAFGNKTHYDMSKTAEDKGYFDYLSYNDDAYMVFIPKDFHGKLRWHTRLGEDSYYNCRVYDFGVIFVRDAYAYDNSLFQALGEPERELYYDEEEQVVFCDKDGKTIKLSVYLDLDSDPEDAITYDTSTYETKDESLDEYVTNKKDVRKNFYNKQMSYYKKMGDMQKDLATKTTQEHEDDFESVVDFCNNLKFPLKVYRGLLWKDKSQVDIDNLGVHWTIDKNFINRNGFETIIVGEVNEDDVDWKNTQHTYIYYSANKTNKENEIWLKKNAKPHNVKIYDIEEFNKNESLNEEVKKDILDALDDEFGQEDVYMWSTYILPNGHFLNPDNSKWWDEINEDPVYEHSDFEDWAWNHEYKGNLQDIWNNCIKMNVTSPYLGMPDKAKPTPEQMRSVKKILDNQDKLMFEQPEWDNIIDDWEKMGPRVLGVFTPYGDRAFDLDVSDADDIIRAINQAYARGGFFNESLNEVTTTVYTYQSPEVLKQLQNGETYIASYDRSMLSNTAYKELARVLGLKNCPIFGGLSKEDVKDMANSSGIDIDDKVLIKLEVPASEVHKMGYYDWTDYIYYQIDGLEEDELTPEQAEEASRNYSGDTPCQVVIDRVEPDWLIK